MFKFFIIQKLKNYLFFIYCWFRYQIQKSTISITSFFQLQPYTLLICNGFFLPSLFVIYRVIVKIFGFPTLFFDFFDFSVETTNCFTFFTLCIVPSFLLFFYLCKKPKKFFAKVFLKGKNLDSFFLLMGRFEYLHFESTLFGFLLYFIIITLYVLLLNTLTPIHFYVLFLIIKYIVFLYISFRGCFLSPHNLIIREVFTDFNNLSHKL